MIRIDHISFEFAAADEAFAHALYADWDSFCRACFESVAEECLAQYGKSKMLHEIETLNLDLGNIPQEDFYREFPQRLREELLKALPSLHFSATEIHEERTEAARLENLLFYLKNGYPQAEWADEDFSLTAELEWVTAQQSRYTEKIIRFSTGGEHILRRLLWHTGNDAVLLKLYAAALSEQTSGLHEKRRFLVMLLEAKPRIPVRYVHESASDTGLHGMAELLDTASVRQIMTTEAEEHAEVDLPPYWHHLYEWLIRYYPFNGLAVFGSKGDFTRHLHYRLLTFIRKRSHSFYLSKTELTAGFLLEVFGHAHYIEVLNAIYNLQPHYPDGSPVHDSYLNRELYRIFLSLSLLRLPAKEEKEEYASQKEQTPYPADKTFLTDFLKDTQKSRADKRMLLVWLIRERPEILTDWLQTEALKDHAPVHILAEIIDETDISRLLASISFTAVEIVEQIKNYLRSHTPATDRLNRTPESKLSLAIRKAVLFWTGGGHSGISKPESIRQLLHLIYREITGRDDADAVEKLSAELHLPEKIRKQYRGNNTAKPDIRKLLAALADTHIPEPAKRRMFALFLEKYGNNYADAILLLHEQGLLNYAVNAISQAIQEEMIRQSVIRIYGEHRAAGLLPLFHRIMAHEPLVAAYLKDNTLGLKARLLLWLAHTDRLQSGEEKTDAASIRSLLTALFGEENMQSVIDRIALETVPQTAFHNMEYGSNTEALSLLLNAGIAKQHASLPDFKKWLRQSENHSKAIQKLLKNRWNTAGEFTRWMEDTAVSPDSKRELLHEIAVEKPRDWIRLLRKQSVESKAVSLLATRMPASLLLQSMAQADFREAALLSQTVEWLQRRISSFPFLSGGSIVFSTVLSQALLLYMQDKETLGGRTLTGKETLHKFLSYLHLAYTGKSSYQDSAEWTDLSVKIAFDMEPGSPQDVPGKEMNEILSRKDTSDTAFSRYIVSMLDKQPEKLLAWLEKGTGASPVARIAAVSDATMLEQWTIFLPTVAGFEHPDAFRRLMTWLIRLAANRALLPDTASVLLSWLSETDWRKQTPEQMENYFFSRLFIKNNITLPVEKLADAALPENTRKILLHRYIRLHPVELLDYIRRSVEQKALPLEKWLEWVQNPHPAAVAGGKPLPVARRTVAANGGLPA